MAPPSSLTASEGTKSAPLILRFVFWLSIAIAVAAVIRRIIALSGSPSATASPMQGLDLAFAGHTALTLAHIVPALAFVLLTPVVMLGKRPGAVWIPKLFYPLGAVVGITAYAMSGYSIGGWLERSAVLVFNSAFLYSLWRAWEYYKRGEAALERRWQLRAIVILLGIATTRPVMGIFFATSRFTHLQPQQFFGMAFWIGFTINTIAVELWLRRKRVSAAA